MSKDMESEYEKWHAQKQMEQMELAKGRKNSFQKFELKSKSKEHELPIESNSNTTDDDIQRENELMLQEMIANKIEEAETALEKEKELTEHEKWHQERQQAQMELANQRRASFDKFQMYSSNN